MGNHIKYPRTLHLPWSRPTSDDKILKDDDIFLGQEVVVTLKMDGENTTMYDDKLHARSLDSNNHYTRNWVKGEWGKIKHQLKGFRICGENVWAKHTISYHDLESYFFVFSIWDDETNICYDWDTTEHYTDLLELINVPVIYRGIYDKEKIIETFKDYDLNEGYVIRNVNSFHYNDFHLNVAKYVKPKFQQAINASDKHWLYDKIEKNLLKSERNNKL